MKDFFTIANSMNIIPPYSPEVIQMLIKSIDAFSHIVYQYVYLIDFYKKEFLYVSGNSNSLFGITPKKMKELGYNFYLNNIPEEEQRKLFELNCNGYKLFNLFDMNEKQKCSLIYSFHIRSGSTYKLISHQITPVLLTNDGKIWIGLCTISLSPFKTFGNAMFYKHDTPFHWEYSFNTHSWKKYENIILKDKEKAILSLSLEGLTMKEIATQIHSSLDTIKSSKHRIFHKLQTKKLTEAILKATIEKLL